MLVLLSPAKNLDFNKINRGFSTSPAFFKEPNLLISALKKLSPQDIQSLMHLSPKHADLNYERYHHFSEKPDDDTTKEACFAFNGEVYNGLNIASFSENELAYAQEHLRVLSGLYGLLKPLDRIQPYRLEMGTKLKTSEKFNDLYQFWGDKITLQLNKQLEEIGSNTLVNLASIEYFKAVKPNLLKAQVYTPVFKDKGANGYKVVMMYAKKARGAMASYILKNKITAIDQLKLYTEEGYLYDPEHSIGNQLVFLRD